MVPGARSASFLFASTVAPWRFFRLCVFFLRLRYPSSPQRCAYGPRLSLRRRRCILTLLSFVVRVSPLRLRACILTPLSFALKVKGGGFCRDRDLSWPDSGVTGICHGQILSRLDSAASAFCHGFCRGQFLPRPGSFADDSGRGRILSQPDSVVAGFCRGGNLSWPD